MTQKTLRSWKSVLCLLLVGLVVWAADSSVQPFKGLGRTSANSAFFEPQNQTTYSGQATVVQAKVLGITTVITDTGPLPGLGGAQEASLLDANVPGLLTAEALHTSTSGQGG